MTMKKTTQEPAVKSTEQKGRGRPTKYSSQTLETANGYYEKCKSDGSIPFIEELAVVLDVNDETVLEWEKVHKEFS
jgi:hypothetical protein